jgi:hypothetical protein
MPSSVPDPVPPKNPNEIKVQVFRVKPGQRWHIRTLSEQYGGLFTHWKKPRSEYCPGEEGGCQLHRTPTFWKGYSAVDVFDETTELWNPAVLEISEHLELDFRNVYRKGQMWLLSRDHVLDHKKPPVRGVCVADVDHGELRELFDVRPVLRTLFHAPNLALDKKNPMPARTVLEAVKGTPPPKTTVQAHNRLSTLMEKAMDERDRKAEENRKARLNGQPH